MRKKILYAFLIIMLLINGLLLFLIIDKKLNSGPSKGQGFLTEELNFSESQKADFVSLDREHRRKMMKMDKQLKDLRELLFSSFGKENISVDSITMKMGDLEEEKQGEIFSFFSQVRKLCNEDQIKRFDAIIQEVLKKRGPRPPKRDGHGPPHGPPREDF